MNVPNRWPPRIVRTSVVLEGLFAVAACGWGWLFLNVRTWQRIHWTATDGAIGALVALPLLVAIFALCKVNIGPIRRLNEVVETQVVPLFDGCTLADLGLISLLAGFGEELLFRGLIQTACQGWFGMAAGLIIASVLFGLLHCITPTYAMVAGLIGLYLGWLWLHFDNLLVPITAHAMYDVLALAYLTRKRPGPEERPLA